MDPGAVFPAFGMAEIAIAGSFPIPGTGLVTDTIDGDLLEAEHVATTVPDDHPNAREIVLLGRPVPGLEFRIVDPETGNVVAERKVGELQIRGTSVTPGYYRHEEANAELFDGDWLKTGDLAYMVDGQMAMCGRIKDLIIVGGRNVYPQDIERAVGSLDGIRAGNVIAFGAAGRHGKEHIVVVAETRLTERLEELRDQVSDIALKAVGVPCRDVVLVKPTTLPKTSSGKLQRSLCRHQYAESSLDALY
jgi:fatty-acyl-CoA synthase